MIYQMLHSSIHLFIIATTCITSSIKYLKAVSLFLKGLISGVDDVISPLISVLSKDLAKFACPKRRRYELLTTQEDLLIYISGDKATLGLTKLLSCVDLAGTILSIEK